MAEAHWYVVHTYSGYENKVKANIEKKIENRHLENEILEVRVPMQDMIEIKNGARKPVQKKRPMLMSPLSILIQPTSLNSLMMVRPSPSPSIPTTVPPTPAGSVSRVSSRRATRARLLSTSARTATMTLPQRPVKRLL